MHFAHASETPLLHKSQQHPSKHQQTQTKPPQKLCRRLLETPFTAADPNLPPAAETTANFPPPLIHRLVESSAALKLDFRNIISQIQPVCIIAHMLFAWTGECIRHPPRDFLCGWRFRHGRLGRHLTEFGLFGGTESRRVFRAWISKRLCVHDQDGEKAMEIRTGDFPGWKETDAMLFNTAEDFDGIRLDYFGGNFTKCSVFAIGPILNYSARGSSEKEKNEMNGHRCMKWLDSNPKKSVLYMAFGSQNSPSENQTLELAKALEASNVNFLWVFRPPPGFVTSNNKNKAANKDYFLPTGFEDRIRVGEQNL